MTPSIAFSFTSAAISVKLGFAEIGRDFQENRNRRRAGGRRCRPRGDNPGKQLGQAFARLHVAQARRVGRRDVDGEIGGKWRKTLHTQFVVGEAVGAVLVGADVDADDAGPARPRRQPRWQRSWPSLLKPSRLITASSPVSRKMRGFGIAGLRQRRDGSDLGEAETQAQQGVGHLAVLVVAGGHAKRIGKVEAAKPGLAGARSTVRRHKSAGRISAQRWKGRGRSPDRRRTAPGGRTIRAGSSGLHDRELMVARSIERQWLHPADSGQFERCIEMRK